jgi:hypothetical protein
VGIGALIALVAAAAAIGSTASTSGKNASTLSATEQSTTTPAGSANDLPLCENGHIPKGAAACRPEGIYPDAQESEIWGWAFQVTNAYSGMYDGRYIAVYGGAVLTPDPTGRSAHGIPGSGGVRVAVNQSPKVSQFLAPGTQGLLSITAVKGGVITLQREDGTTVTFSLATDMFG